MSQNPQLTEDAARWRKLVSLVAENQRRATLGGGIVLCSAPANEHDAPWASIQALDHENPRGAVWLVEGATLDEVIDAVPVAPRVSEEGEAKTAALSTTSERTTE